MSPSWSEAVTTAPMLVLAEEFSGTDLETLGLAKAGASLTSLTVMVTVMVSYRPPGSWALRVMTYSSRVSWSRSCPVWIWPVAAATVKPAGLGPVMEYSSGVVIGVGGGDGAADVAEPAARFSSTLRSAVALLNAGASLGSAVMVMSQERRSAVLAALATSSVTVPVRHQRAQVVPLAAIWMEPVGLIAAQSRFGDAEGHGAGAVGAPQPYVRHPGVDR